jgi:hypothetical protein
MGSVREFSDQVADFAERLADVVDAAQGKGTRRGRMGVRWMTLSAAGAGLYALATSDVVTRRVKGVMQGAKARASELPDDLLARVEQAAGVGDDRQQNGGKTKAARSAGSRRGRSSTGTRSTRSRSTASGR